MLQHRTQQFPDGIRVPIACRFREGFYHLVYFFLIITQLQIFTGYKGNRIISTAQFSGQKDRCRTFRAADDVLVESRSRIGQAEPGCARHQRHGCCRDSRSGLFIPENILNPALHGILSKCHRRTSQKRARCGKLQQEGTVTLFFLRPQLFQHLFIAGHLHIPGQQYKGQPQQGIEPVYHTYQPGQQFYPGILTPLMGLLMRQYQNPFF